jgi:hypothetical protein
MQFHTCYSYIFPHLRLRAEERNYFELRFYSCLASLHLWVTAATSVTNGTTGSYSRESTSNNLISSIYHFPSHANKRFQNHSLFYCIASFWNCHELILVWRLPFSRMWCRVDVVRTDVSEERSSSICRVRRMCEWEKCQAFPIVCFICTKVLFRSRKVFVIHVKYNGKIFNANWINRSYVELMLWPKVSRPIRLDVRHPFGTNDQIFFYFLLSDNCFAVHFGVPSLTRGRVCNWD